MDENWDDVTQDTPTPKPTVDVNNNTESEPRKFGFGSRDENTSDKKPFGRGRPSGENGEEKRGFGFGNRNQNNDSEGGERKNFNSFRRNNDDNGERKEGFGGGFRRNDNQDGGERKSFTRRDNNDSEGGERKPFRKFGNDDNGGERRSFNRNNEGGGGFGRRNNDENGERRPFVRRENNDSEGGEKKGFGSFGRRNDGEGGDKKPFGGFGNRDGGERKPFGRRENNDSEGGEKKGFGSFGGRRNDEEGGEKKSFRSFGNREDGGERKPFGNRDKSSGDGERRSFKRDGEGGFGKPRRDDEEGGAKKDGEAEGPKREKYIPEDVEETEESLFSTLKVGVNFKKQAEIKTTLSGTGSDSIKPISSFKEPAFTELLMQNITKTKYEIPTAVQKYAIPIIISRRDLMACAQTGSGKTAAFVLPIMKNIIDDGLQSSSLMDIQKPQALILSPTRELALQIFHECKKFSHDSMIKTAILYGGVDTGFQLRKLEQGCNILVATPGRLLDVLEKKKISLENVKYFVLDEADRMLDLGFEKAVREILEKGQVHKKGDRCTFMFSATFPNEIQQLAQDFLHDYLFLAVGEVGGANTDVEQTMFKVTRFEKRNKCLEILDEIGSEKTMIFVESKKNVDIIAFFLIQKGYPTTSIHGDRLQSQREMALNEFKSGKSTIIVCTAVAARGLDIEKVNHVINFDLPSSIDEYVHRIGRTGRCGNLGKAISFFDPESENDRKLARPLVRILTQAQQQVPEWLTSIAEDSVGTTFTGNSCATDLRGKFKSLSVDSKPAPAAAAAGAAEEESWD